MRINREFGAGRSPVQVKKFIPRAIAALGWSNCRKRACVAAPSSSINNSISCCRSGATPDGSCCGKAGSIQPMNFCDRFPSWDPSGLQRACEKQNTTHERRPVEQTHRTTPAKKAPHIPVYMLVVPGCPLRSHVIVGCGQREEWLIIPEPLRLRHGRADTRRPRAELGNRAGGCCYAKR